MSVKVYIVKDGATNGQELYKEFENKKPKKRAIEFAKDNFDLNPFVEEFEFNEETEEILKQEIIWNSIDEIPEQTEKKEE